MKRRVAWVVVVAVVLVAGVTAAVAVNGQNGDDRWSDRGMMTSQRSARPYDGSDWPHRGWQGPGPMMFGGMTGMHGARRLSEYAYLAEMRAHHEEAVSAAQQLQRSDRPQMRELGASIVASQSAQIDQMRGWLADWYPDQTGRVDYRPMMRDLSGLSGDRLDRAFLQDMIWHHMAAVMMSQRLLASGAVQHDQVRALAESIRDEQHAEMFQMQRWLRDWFGVGWQHGMHGPRGDGWSGMGGWMMR